MTEIAEVTNLANDKIEKREQKRTTKSLVPSTGVQSHRRERRQWQHTEPVGW